MPDLSFHVENAHAVRYAASPLLALRVVIRQNVPPGAAPSEIQSIALQCQVRLEPGLRRYSPGEQEKLYELFGEPRRWGQTVRSTLWVNTSAAVPGFIEQTSVDMPVPCTFDFNIAQTKYFHALEDGIAPLCLLFSGTVFYHDTEGSLRIQQIPWEKEASFQFPVRVWKEMMDLYYPNTAWLCVHRDLLDRLAQFKVQNGSPSWDHALESLLSATNMTIGAEVSP
jgi:hypothetical protein